VIRDRLTLGENQATHMVLGIPLTRSRQPRDTAVGSRPVDLAAVDHHTAPTAAGR
jgi:hypothetical protein